MLKKDIAKKYLEVLLDGLSIEKKVDLKKELELLVDLFKDEATLLFANSPIIDFAQKWSILAPVCETFKFESLKNIFQLLLKKSQMNLLLLMLEALKEDISQENRIFEVDLYSDAQLNQVDLQQIQKAIERRFDGRFKLHYGKETFNGIKAYIRGLDCEISINRLDIKNSLIAKIIKAI